MSVCSLVTAGVLASPAIASADSGSELIGTTTQAHSHAAKMQAFERALEAAELRPEQKKQVDELKSAHADRYQPVMKVKGELMRAVADQIEQGKIDRCALEPQVQRVASAMVKAKKGDRADFEKLHEILDPQQRTRFVDTLKEQFESMKRTEGTNAILDKMDRELNLRDDQKSQLREILDGLKQIKEASPEYTEYRNRMRRVLEAFKGERFSFDEIAPMGKDAEERIAKRIDARLWAGEAILPVLDAEQRTKLAKLLRDKAGERGERESERGTMQEDRYSGEREQGEVKEQKGGREEQEQEEEDD